MVIVKRYVGILYMKEQMIFTVLSNQEHLACSAVVIALRFGTQGPGFKPGLFHKACYMPLHGCWMKLRVFFNQEHVIMVTNARHNFQRELSLTIKRGKLSVQIKWNARKPGKLSVQIKWNAAILCHDIVQQTMAHLRNLSVTIKKQKHMYIGIWVRTLFSWQINEWPLMNLLQNQEYYTCSPRSQCQQWMTNVAGQTIWCVRSIRLSLISTQALFWSSNRYQKKSDWHPTELKPSNRILSKLDTRSYYLPKQQYRAEGWKYSENAQHQK